MIIGQRGAPPARIAASGSSDSSSAAARACVHGVGLVAGDEDRVIPVPVEEREELALGDAREHRRVRDLVAVQVEDRQDRPVALRIDELVGVPARRERPGLRLAVPDDAHGKQIRVVEHCAVRVRKRVAELPALMNRSRRLRSDMARDAAWKRELPEQTAEPLFVLADVGVQLAIRSFEVRVRDHPRAAVARAADVDRVDIARADHAVHVGIDQVEPGRRAPMAEQPWLDVLGRKRLLQERVVQEIDLADRQVVRGAPVRVDQAQLVGRHCLGSVLPDGGVCAPARQRRLRHRPRPALPRAQAEPEPAPL